MPAVSTMTGGKATSAGRAGEESPLVDDGIHGQTPLPRLVDRSAGLTFASCLWSSENDAEPAANPGGACFVFASKTAMTLLRRSRLALHGRMRGGSLCPSKMWQKRQLEPYLHPRMEFT
mmetsp:Transcript_48210/g.140468  ORF Transcript_48210/g.140468 Transcript_48210/m.140468 type:complete len:119 (+) Transcript_48210:251-607(+)